MLPRSRRPGQIAARYRRRRVRLLLIVNSSASSVTARGRVVIRKALSADHEVALAETSRRGHATRLAQGAANEGVDAVVVLGGDGTLNEAANGLAGTDTALAALPGGSTNVFARTIGLPNDPIEATAALLDGLARGNIVRVGLGSVNGRYFLFHVGMGFDAAVVQQVERRAGLKRYAGHPLFVYAGFATWFRHYDKSRPRFAVHHADGTIVDDAYLAICLNTNPYTFLGSRPLDLAPEATLDRGLTMVTFRTLEFAKVMRVIGEALGGKRGIGKHKFVDYRTDVDKVTVDGHGPFPYQVDGDYLGETDHLEFRHDPEILRLVMP
jgi:diacylglycerol kinase family enzyme